MTEWHPLRSTQQIGSKSWQKLNQEATKRAKTVESAEMPSLDHLSMSDFEQVYEPSGDTFLLIDGIQYDFMTHPNLIHTTCQVLEIGCGSGVPIVFLGMFLLKQQQQQQQQQQSTCSLTSLFVTDINPFAIRIAQRTAIANGLSQGPFQLQAIQCDLASALLPTKCKIDILLFNPPYVPTPNDEVAGNGIEASWAGGINGRCVIDRAMPQIAQLLSQPNGICYMITVDDNKPEEMAREFSNLGLQMEPLLRRRSYNEYLTVQKITWKQGQVK